nr:helix-turn-helix transcriptional regulator [Clostridia bacterium]
MQLSEKIITLRKSRNMTQEQLAETLDVSRQAVSRWEVGSALPDAMNVLQLSRLFGVSADYLLNDDYESDRDIPAVKHTQATEKKFIKSISAFWVAVLGFLGNFVIYVLSRFIKVHVPFVTIDNGQKMWHWSSDHMGYSYRYFIGEHNLHLIAAISGLLFIAGLIALAVINRDNIKTFFTGLRRKK